MSLADVESPAHAWAQILTVMGIPGAVGWWWAMKHGDDGWDAPHAKWWHDQTTHAARIDPGIALARRELPSADD